MSDDIKNIIILGNSGSARECYMNLKAVMKVQENIKFKGFLSFEGYEGDLGKLSHYFLGVDDDYNYQENDYVIIGLGNPILRKKAFYKLKEKNVKLYNLIHPKAHIDETCEVGEGNVITPDCYFSCDVKIGNGNYFNGFTNSGHDVKIGDFNFIGPHVHFLGDAFVGDLNSIGTMSVLLPNSKIGNGNKIAPLSAIYKGCKNNCYLQGNPAIKIGINE